MKLDQLIAEEWEFQGKPADIVFMKDYILWLLSGNSDAEMTAPQRLHRMITGKGSETAKIRDEEVPHYYFFDDLQDGKLGPNAIIGMEHTLARLVGHLEAASKFLGAEKRQVLLHGPVGSAKSTVVTLLKRGLEAYSLEVPLFTFGFENLGPVSESKIIDGMALFDYTPPMSTSPIYLIPEKQRAELVKKLNDKARRMQLGDQNPFTIQTRGRLDPLSQLILSKLLAHYKGDWDRAMAEHVRVYHIHLSEAERRGITTFEPADPKNLDLVELIGGPDFSRIGRFGNLGDPRTYNFNGALMTGNRGLVEVIEMLRLPTEFLYTLLSANAEQQVKPRYYAHVPVDTFIVGHSNEAALREKLEDPQMEAFMDRTVLVPMPYSLKLSHETAIHDKVFTPDSVGKHIGPHANQAASAFALLTRYETETLSPGGTMDQLLQKLQVYDDQSVDKANARQLLRDFMAKAKREGFDGLGPRWVENILNMAASDSDGSYQECIDAVAVLKTIKGYVADPIIHPTDKHRERLKTLHALTSDFIGRVLKDDVMRASTTEASIREVGAAYIRNVSAYVNSERVFDPQFRETNQPDERLMQAIEAQMGVSEDARKAFRQSFVERLGATAVLRGESSLIEDYLHQPNFRNAVIRFLYDTAKHTIDFRAIVTGSKRDDPQQQAIVHSMTTRLIGDMNYCTHCSANAIQYVARIIAKEGSK